MLGLSLARLNLQATYNLAPQSGVVLLIENMGVRAGELERIITIRDTACVVLGGWCFDTGSDFVYTQALLVRLAQRGGLYRGGYDGLRSIHM